MTVDVSESITQKVPQCYHKWASAVQVLRDVHCGSDIEQKEYELAHVCTSGFNAMSRSTCILTDAQTHCHTSPVLRNLTPGNDMFGAGVLPKSHVPNVERISLYNVKHVYM